jgi:predicted membrane-bound dolichyl-phosphate-mannose-protein mannosyltransferase
MARFIPAIVGSALVFAPYYFRDRLKPLPALILAFLFAFDPGLVALSRQANGTILALTFLLFAWGMWRNGRAVPAGIFAGLALLSGPSLWSGLLMLGLTSSFCEGKEIQADRLRITIYAVQVSLSSPRSSWPAPSSSRHRTD